MLKQVKVKKNEILCCDRENSMAKALHLNILFSIQREQQQKKPKCRVKENHFSLHFIEITTRKKNETWVRL